jgi:hypothetical protein
MIRKWGPCQTLSEVRAFLGTVGVIRIFIKNFSLRAHPLIKLTRKDEPFIFGPEQIKVQEDLKAGPGKIEDRDDEEDFADWIDQLHGFLHHRSSPHTPF